jgi:hypothetical protein
VEKRKRQNLFGTLIIVLKIYYFLDSPESFQLSVLLKFERFTQPVIYMSGYGYTFIPDMATDRMLCKGLNKNKEPDRNIC